MLSEVTELPSVQLGEYTLQFELGEPTERAKEVAIKELRETPENKEAAIKELKLLMQGKFYRIVCLIKVMELMEWNVFLQPIVKNRKVI